MAPALRVARLPVLVAAGAAWSSWLWLQNQAASPAGAGEWLTELGRLTGLEGTFAALVTVQLIARPPWVERVHGLPVLWVWHRRLGQATVGLLLAHTVLIVWGYALTDHVGLVHETKHVVLDLPDVLAATVAMGLLIGVSVLGVRAARSRVRYETWHFTHLYTYLAIALSFAHQFATGREFTDQRGNRIAWTVLFVAVFGQLLVFRVVRPLVWSVRHDLRVTDVVEEASGSVSVHIGGRGLLRAQPRAGQFYLWRFLTRSGWWQAHPFSLSEPATEQSLRITMRAAGDFSGAGRRIPLGARVIAEGPYGTFTAAVRTRPHVLLVAAGAGIAPIRALADDLCGAADVTLIYRASSPSEAALLSELDALTARGLQVHVLTGSRHDAVNALDAASLGARVTAPLRDHDVYLCGPPSFMSSMGRVLRSAGVPARQIHAEMFAT